VLTVGNSFKVIWPIAIAGHIGVQLDARGNLVCQQVALVKEKNQVNVFEELEYTLGQRLVILRTSKTHFVANDTSP
jgi:hypothetical protein